jgi:hypothetical protein
MHSALSMQGRLHRGAGFAGIVLLGLTGMSFGAGMARAAPLGVRTRLVRIGQLSAIQLRSTILGKPANNSPVTFDVILRP